MVSWLIRVSVLVTVILALGITEPDGSVTTPITRPVASCAGAGWLQNDKTIKTSSIGRHCQRVKRVKLNMMFPYPFPITGCGSGQNPDRRTTAMCLYVSDLGDGVNENLVYLEHENLGHQELAEEMDRADYGDIACI